MLDGACHRATGGGVVTSPPDDARVLYAVVTHFQSDLSLGTRARDHYLIWQKSLDAARPSENLFVGIRVDGRFEKLSMRAACAAEVGEDLLAATAHQSEFTVVEEEGTLVGFWAPLYTRAVNVPGYHFHFLSEDRRSSAVICSTWKRVSSRSGDPHRVRAAHRHPRARGGPRRRPQW